MIGLYVSSVCKKPDNPVIYPDERTREIEKVTDADLKNQKISSWKLLEKGVRDCFGFSLTELNFTKSAEGKWACDKLYFSLSHTQKRVAVAVSDKPVGVDIESLQAFNMRRTEKLSQKILCDNERADNSKELLRLWTGKESVFKCLGGAAFAPHKIRVADYPVYTAEYGGYIISVCGEGVRGREIEIKEIII